jgi:hypothetical protein
MSTVEGSSMTATQAAAKKEHARLCADIVRGIAEMVTGESTSPSARRRAVELAGEIGLVGPHLAIAMLAAIRRAEEGRSK